jgi:hypothetical protein
MTDEKKNPAPADTPDFGEIQIDGKAAPHRPRVRSAASAARPPKAAPPEKKSARQKKAGRAGGKSRICFVLLLLLPPALLLIWLAGALYLLPLYVQGPLAEKLSRQLGRPVTVGKASLAPFKLLLRLSEIAVGPAAGRADEPELARIASAEARIRPYDLLKGQLVLEDIRVDRLRASLIRRSDGSFNALPPGGFFSGLSLLPPWLRLHDLRLHRSTVHFFDQPSGKKHLVEHIEFALPAAGQGLDPSLSAVVNSSPLQLIGQRQESGGGPETRLTLKLDNLDPQQYLGLFPELASSLSLSAERADAVLEISLREKGASGKGLSATGSVTFSSLLAQSADHEERPEQAFRLTSPTAHVIVRVNPMEQLHTVEELLLEEPQLDLPPNMAGLLDGSELAAKAAALLNPAETGLAVGRLILTKGQVRSGGKNWTDVQLELTGFKNVKAAAQSGSGGPAQLSLGTRSGASSFSFTGAADPAFNLNGSLSLQNAQADWLRPFLAADEGLRLAKGGADIAGELRLEQQAEGRPGLTVTGGTVALRNFTLQRQKAVLLTAKSLRGSDCVLDSAAGSMRCGKAALDGADFADTAFFLPGAKKGGLNFSCGELELKNSSAQLPFGPASLPLSGLSLSLQADSSLKLAAAAGKQGSIEINGAAAKSKTGAVALSGKLLLKNVSADLLHPYLSQGRELRFKQGGADISGSFSLNGPSLSLSDSSVTLRNFALQRGEAVLLSGKAASGSDCSLDGSGKSMSCGKISLDGADFADSGFFLRPAGRLRLSAKVLELKDSSAKLPFGGAELPLSGLKMSLNGLTSKQPGQVSLEAAAGSGRLEISGEAVKSEAGLALSGQLNLRGADAELLQPYLGEGISMIKGVADISGGFSLNGAVLNLSGGAVALRDFALQREGTALVSGKSASGSDCSLDGSGKSMSCGKISLDGADFTDTAFFLRPAGRLRLSAKVLELKDSSAKLALGAASLPLSGLKMSIGSLPGPVSLEAAAGSGRLEISGEAEKTETGLSLGGSVTLRQAEASLLNPYLGDELRFSRGKADMSGAGHLSAGGDGASLHFSIGALTVRDFSLQRGESILLSGKAASGADCALDGAASSMSCGRISLEGADFAAAAPGFFFRPAGRLGFAADTVEISSSSAQLPVGQAVLPLSGLKMSLSGLRSAQPPQNNFHFAAAAGPGSLKAEGHIRRDGSGIADLTAESLDIRLFSKAFASLLHDSLSLKQGSLSAKGEFRLPESRFSGRLSMDSFAAETSQGDSLSWRRAATDKAALSLSPFAAAAERLDVEEPQLRLASAASGLPGAFLGLFAALPQIALEQCVLSGGSLRLGGSSFSGVQGSIGPVKTGAAALFSFSGKMGGSDFSASGSAGRDSAKLDKLTVERMPLEKTGQLLAKQLALNSSWGKVTRSLSAEGDRLDFSGFIPLPASDYSFTLALLTGKDGNFSMPMQGLPAAAEEELIAATAAEAVRKLRLQSTVSPWNILEKIVPGLSKAQSIDFLPGDKVPDFMDGLDGIRDLSALRPHLGWAVKGCYDKEADRKTLLAQTEKAAAQKTEEENLRRKQELDRLLAQETLRQQTLNKAGLPIIKDMLPEIKAQPDLQPLPAPQAELPDSVLPELARARAEVAQAHLVSKLGVPADRVRVEKSGDCGAKAELTPAPFW